MSSHRIRTKIFTSSECSLVTCLTQTTKGCHNESTTSRWNNSRENKQVGVESMGATLRFKSVRLHQTCQVRRSSQNLRSSLRQFRKLYIRGLHQNIPLLTFVRRRKFMHT
ncbi:hypothetical protein M758_9G082100 [Ceratodon purpureus]|nr:hypothetical protein M758_9G082100 [Ceratodon purpureus]